MHETVNQGKNITEDTDVSDIFIWYMIMMTTKRFVHYWHFVRGNHL